MYSLSTSWNSNRHTNGFDIAREISSTGFDGIELDWSLPEGIVRDILALKKSSAIKISSLHNICPLPDGVSPSEATPDYYSLASLDKEDRMLAVRWAKNTIDYAKKLEAGAVILHTGRIHIRDRTRMLGASFGDKERFVRLRDEIIKERDRNKDGYLDNVMESLSELVGHSLKTGVPLAIENRYYYSEIPLIEEFDIIFENFNNGELYYWHDAGHAEIFERLTLARHKDFLDKFSNRLIGIHLHDIIGLMADHKVPGSGTFDFGILKPYLSARTLKVVEVHQPASAIEIREGKKYLETILGE